MKQNLLIFLSSCTLIFLIGCGDDMDGDTPVDPVSMDSLDCLIKECNWQDGSGSLGVFEVEYNEDEQVAQYGFQAFAFQYDDATGNPTKATIVNNGGVDVQFEFFYNEMELTHIVESWGTSPTSPNATFNVTYNAEGLITRLTDQNSNIFSYDYDENGNPIVWMVHEFLGNASDRVVDIVYGTEKGLVDEDDLSHTHAFIYSTVELNLPFLMFKNSIKGYSIHDNGTEEENYTFDQCSFNEHGYQISAIDSSIDEGFNFTYECD